MLSIKTNVRGVETALRGMAKRTSDTDGTLKRWVGFMRHKAKERFDQLAGPPLAQSTRTKYERTRTSSVTAQGKVRSSYARKLAVDISAKHRDKSTRQVSERGQELLAELRRLSHGGSTNPSMVTAHDKTLEALRKKLERAKSGKRVGGNKRKIERHKLLGKLVKSLVGSISGLSAILRNRVPWSGVQNEGGKVGNNAQIPARTTLQLLREDVTELVKIRIEHIIGKGKR